MSRRRRFASRAFAALATIAIATTVVAACGAPSRVRSLDGEPDLVHISDNAIPHGFSASTSEELVRLRSTCTALGSKVATELPDVASGGAVADLDVTDGECQWLTAPSAGAPGLPELIVGILANPAGSTLDQTDTVIKAERAIAGVGDRAVFDAQTRTLYVVTHDRLWYLQLVGDAPGVAAPAILTALGRALVDTPAAR